MPTTPPSRVRVFTTGSALSFFLRKESGKFDVTLDGSIYGSQEAYGDALAMALLDGARRAAIYEETARRECQAFDARVAHLKKEAEVSPRPVRNTKVPPLLRRPDPGSR